jgi:hypothetical protein
MNFHSHGGEEKLARECTSRWISADLESLRIQTKNLNPPHELPAIPKTFQVHYYTIPNWERHREKFEKKCCCVGWRRSKKT